MAAAGVTFATVEFQSPKGRLQTFSLCFVVCKAFVFQSPKGRLQTFIEPCLFSIISLCFNPQRGGYKLDFFKGVLDLLMQRFQSPKGRLQTKAVYKNTAFLFEFQSPKGRLQTR